MKRIIALSSFLVLLLMAVLPANVSHAAAANEDAVQGIKFFMENGTTINAVKEGSNFTLDLVGDVDFGDQMVTKAEIYSKTAATLSMVPSDFDYSTVAPLTKDDLDIQFVNGVAVLDVEKVINWSKRVGGENPELEIPNGVFTLSEFKGIASAASNFMGYGEQSPYVLPGYVTDQDGNESEITLTVIAEGWKYTTSGWKYFDEYGDYLTGWFQDENGTWYYLADNGVMKTGWFKDTNGKWYYLNGNGSMATGWAKVSNKWYYLDAENGDMKTGWFKDTNGKWYYLNASGAMATGWAKVSNKWYYLNANGDMATGWVKVSNKWYYLYSDGHMAANTKIGSYRVGRDGAWIQ